MRLALAALICLGLFAACEARPVQPESASRRLGLRSPEDAPRTTAGAGTSGHEERLLLDLPAEPVPGAPDPTTGTTSGGPARPEPHGGGTTGGSPAPLPDDSGPLPA